MIITGTLFRDMCISAANALENNKEELNNLNVFPVPDGDTGINMSMTLRTLSTELRNFEGTISECAEKVARVALRAARGNSGVILSLFFRGLAKELHGLEEADSIHMARAFKTGVAEAYRAVMTPTEGTILTVMRVSADRAIERAETDFAGKVESLFAYMVVVAIETLQKTPELLPALKLAHVVDAGGAGFVKMIEGMLLALQGAPVELKAGAIEDKEGSSAFEAFSTEDIKFGYCTECIVEKDAAHRGEGTAEEFRQLVMSIGDSVVFVDDEEIIKVHVHTNNPGKAMEEALKYGQFETVKVENMRIQHENAGWVEEEDASAAQPVLERVEPENEYGFVAVAAGEGLKALFHDDLACDQVVSGGQTMNPSTDDILSAIEATPAKTVFVLPNNKNIILAAEQAVPLADRRVCVLPTRTIPQGISAMLAFDPDGDVEANLIAMQRAADNVSTGSLTFAARDSDFEGHKIKEGQILALDNGKLSFVDTDVNKAATKLAKNMALGRRLAGKELNFVTVIYGEDVAEEQAEAVCEGIRAKLGDNVDVSALPGGQPVYYYFLSME